MKYENKLRLVYVGLMIAFAVTFIVEVHFITTGVLRYNPRYTNKKGLYMMGALVVLVEGILALAVWDTRVKWDTIMEVER